MKTTLPLHVVFTKGDTVYVLNTLKQIVYPFVLLESAHFAARMMEEPGNEDCFQHTPASEVFAQVMP